MELEHRWTDRNLTRMELVCALLILALLIGTFTQRSLVMFSLAERYLVNSAVTNINTALRYRYAIAILRKDEQSIRGLLAMNPMALLQINLETQDELLTMNPIVLLQTNPENKPVKYNKSEDVLKAMEQVRYPTPDNYRGEFDVLDYSSLEEGAWYYNKADRTLIYMIRNHEFFVTDLAGAPRIEYRLVPEYIDVDKNGQFDAKKDRLKSVTLQSVSVHHWEF